MIVINLKNYKFFSKELKKLQEKLKKSSNNDCGICKKRHAIIFFGTNRMCVKCFNNNYLIDNLKK